MTDTRRDVAERLARIAENLEADAEGAPRPWRIPESTLLRRIFDSRPAANAPKAMLEYVEELRLCVITEELRDEIAAALLRSEGREPDTLYRCERSGYEFTVHGPHTAPDCPWHGQRCRLDSDHRRKAESLTDSPTSDPRKPIADVLAAFADDLRPGWREDDAAWGHYAHLVEFLSPPGETPYPVSTGRVTPEYAELLEMGPEEPSDIECAIAYLEAALSDLRRAARPTPETGT